VATAFATARVARTLLWPCVGQVSVLNVFRSLCQDAWGMLELFINYDMATDRIDLFQKLLETLTSIAQGSTSADFNASQVCVCVRVHVHAACSVCPHPARRKRAYGAFAHAPNVVACVLLPPLALAPSQRTPAETASIRLLAMEGVTTLMRSLSSILDFALAPAGGVPDDAPGGGEDDEGEGPEEAAVPGGGSHERLSLGAGSTPMPQDSSLSLVESYDLRVRARALPAVSCQHTCAAPRGCPVAPYSEHGCVGVSSCPRTSLLAPFPYPAETAERGDAAGGVQVQGQGAGWHRAPREDWAVHRRTRLHREGLL
jgi:hypothetical protein